MSRRDVEDLIKQLRDAVKDAPPEEQVCLERQLFTQAVEGLGRLEQALDNRPSLIKKLNEKIIKLEGELEILRNETRVNELEKKVQRLEGELQRSYATKNFTLKNGLLEIEKAYREFICGSPAVQSLWDEITLLLVEDKESLPQNILARRNLHIARVAEAAAAAAAAESPMGPLVAAAAVDPSQSTSYVQQQVDKFKDYTFTPGTLDPHDPNHPANQHGGFHPSYFPGGTPAASMGGAPDARAGDVVDDRPTGLENLTQIREQYDEAQAGAPMLAPHWGTLVPEPSPLRPVSLFSAGGEGKAPDAYALDACRDELSTSLEHLKVLFAQYDWAPAPVPQQASPGAGEQAPTERRLPDASAFTSMTDSLEISVERLRDYFSRMHWAPGSGTGSGGGDSDAAAGAGAGAAAVPDARYFDVQAEVLLASVQRLRQQFQDAATEAAAAAAAAAGAGSGGGAGGGAAGADGTGGGAAAGKASVIPDARYFETQADAIAASVNQLLRLYERSSTGNTPTPAGGAASHGPWPAAAAGGARAPGGAVALTPDARAGDGGSDDVDAAVQPLIDLFSSFMAHLDATHGSAGASGPWPQWWHGRPGGDAAARGAGGVEGGDGAEPVAGPDAAAQMQQADLVRLFAQFARAWPAMAAAVAAQQQRRTAGAGSAAATGGADGGAVRRPESGDLELVYGASGAAAGSGAVGSGTRAASSSAPSVRFRISVNTTGTSSDAVSAHLSTAPSLTSTSSVDQLRRLDGSATAAAAAAVADGACPSGPAAPTLPAGLAAAAAGPAAAASAAATGGRAGSGALNTPIDVLLASLESRHGRGLATSPQAVAVWRDLLLLLGIDPNTRPVPTQGSAAAAPRRRSKSAASTPSRAAALAPLAAAAAAAAAASGDPPPLLVLGALPSWRDEPGPAGGAAAAPAGSADVAGARERREGAAAASQSAWESATREVGDHAAVAAAVGGFSGEGPAEGGRAAASACSASAGTVSGGDGGACGEDEARDGGVTTQGSTDPAAAAAAVAAGYDGGDDGDDVCRSPAEGRLIIGSEASADGVFKDTVAPTAAVYGEGLEGPSTPEDAPRDAGGLASEEVAATTAPYSDGGEGPGSHTPPLDGAASSSSAGAAAAVAQQLQLQEGSGEEDRELERQLGQRVDQGADGEGSDWSGSQPLSGDGQGEDADGASAGPGLMAGGVRFQITLSEIIPEEEEETQPRRLTSGDPASFEQQQVQFRANVGGGVDPAVVAATEAELAQLRQVRHSLSEQLSATQELVLHLNRQLKGVLESRDDVRAELAAALADGDEARHESDMFMRDLVETKVQLAEVQGEYMQVYQALKRALGNEKGMMAKIDELERILAVVGPGDVSVDDDFGSAVGQASVQTSLQATPREDAVEATEGGDAEAAYGEGYTGSSSIKSEGGGSGRKSGERGPVSLMAGPRGASSGGRSTSSGSGRGGSGGGGSGGGGILGHALGSSAR